MKFNPKTYQPIDYKNWILGDEARKGINIKRLNILTEQELKVWEESIKYQDARNDPGHAEISTNFAIKLLAYYPKAIREIVVPTIIDHDIGWYGNDPEAWQKTVLAAQKEGNLASLSGSDVRMPHQVKGAELAKIVFEKANYPDKKYHQEGFNIILDHDTRLKPTTESGEVVRAADYLFRVSLPCNQIYLFSKGITNPNKILKRAEECCLESKHPHNLRGISQQIARIEIANTLYFKFPDQAEKVLKPKYSEELQLIKRFYSKSL